jgi:hypothetical protein
MKKLSVEAEVMRTGIQDWVLTKVEHDMSEYHAFMDTLDLDYKQSTEIGMIVMQLIISGIEDGFDLGFRCARNPEILLFPEPTEEEGGSE